MPPQYSTTPFVEELPRLLAARKLSLRTVAQAANVSTGHLSRVLRGVDYKAPSGDLTARVAAALGLPRDYFPEFRRSVVVDRIRKDGDYRDKLYRELTESTPGKK